jgi:hypothetical protein
MIISVIAALLLTWLAFRCTNWLKPLFALEDHEQNDGEQDDQASRS